MQDGYNYLLDDRQNVVEPPQTTAAIPQDQPIFPSTAPAGGMTVVDRPAMPQPFGFRVTAFHFAVGAVAIGMIATFISITSSNEQPPIKVAALQETTLKSIGSEAISRGEQTLEEANLKAKIALRDTLADVSKSKTNVLLQAAIADGKNKKSKCYRLDTSCYLDNVETEIITRYTQSAEAQDWDTMALLTFQYSAIQDARKGEVTLTTVPANTTASILQGRLNTQIRTQKASVEAIATEIIKK